MPILCATPKGIFYLQFRKALCWKFTCLTFDHIASLPCFHFGYLRLYSVAI